MKILHVELSNTIGGIETFLLNISQNIDLKKYVFEMLTTSMVPVYENEFAALNIPIYKIPPYWRLFSYCKAFSRLLKNNKYDIVHIHKNSLANPIPILIAKRYCKNIVIHSHNTKPSKGKVTFFFHKINRCWLHTKSFLRLACSEEAAKWMYGNSAEKDKDYFLIKNGVDVKKFSPNKHVRDNMRKTLGVENDYVLCNVGRFTEQKNHSFLIEMFARFHERFPDSKLLLVGMGPLLDSIKKQVKEMSLTKAVLFLGQRKDIPQLLQAADVFVFPSIYEGLGIVGIEAQASGLLLVASDRVPKDVDVMGNVVFLRLEDSIDLWCDKIASNMSVSNKNDADFIKQRFNDKGYNIVETVSRLTYFYNQYIGKN